MKKLMNRIIPAVLIVVSGLLMTCLNSCKQDHLVYSTTSQVNMYSYLQQNQDQFSLFTQIIDKAGYGSFLNTYGSYTLFMPNNTGVTAYLKANNYANVGAIDVATAKQLVAITLIADTLTSTNFTDGKLRTPTTSGQYLITSTSVTNNISSVVINKQANLVKPNIRVGNGYVHIIDYVLSPATLTLAQTVAANPKYTIFTAVLKATGLYDTLNVPTASATQVNRKYLTLIAQTDSTFKAAGFADYNAVKAKYSTKGDPTNHADSLWLFAAYRVWPELSYLSDIANSTSHSTLAPLEVTTSQLVGQNVLLNNDTFNGILEPGQQLYRPASDVSCTNGVMHTVLTNYKIKVRLPSPVYFDVTDQPEVRKTPGLYKSTNNPGYNFLIGQIAGITTTGSTDVNNRETYNSEPAIPVATDYYYNNDWFNIGLRFRTGTNASNVSSITFVTPVIVKGRYKIWVDYKRFGTGQTIPTAFDGIALPNTFNNADQLNGAETDAQAEARGFKSYSESPLNQTTPGLGAYNQHVGRLLGVVDVLTTDHHKISFTATAATGTAAQFLLDCIEFRPIDMDQIHPRLGRAGNLVP